MTKPTKVDAYMPLWIGDYLADTMGFKALQHGAYLLLLMAYWRQRAPLVDDDDELAGIARCTAAEWKVMRPKLARKFQVGDGLWRHGRADEELTTALERKENAIKKASAGGKAKQAKALKQAEQGASSTASGSASSTASSTVGAVLDECPSTSPTTSPSESSEPNGSGAADAPPAVDKSTDPKRIAWRDCGIWFVTNGVAESSAREVMGKVLKDYPAVALDAFVAVTKLEATPDPKAYLIATAKRMAGEQRTVPSDAAEQTAAYLAAQAAQAEAAKSPEAQAARLALVNKVHGKAA